MYRVINDKLSLKTLAAPGDVRGISDTFSLPEGDNAFYVTFIVLALTGPAAGIIGTLQETDDQENWTDVTDFVFVPATEGSRLGPVMGVGRRFYRVRWLFGSLDPFQTVSCIIAANVETTHV